MTGGCGCACGSASASRAAWGRRALARGSNRLELANVTVDGKGFLVDAGTGRPTRIPVPKSAFKALSADTGGAYTFGEYDLTYDFPPHIHHREDEGIYVLEGRITVSVGDDTFSMGPGDFAFMPKDVVHSITLASERPVRILAVSTPGGFEHLMEDLTEINAAGHDTSSSEWQALEAKHGWTLI